MSDKKAETPPRPSHTIGGFCLLENFSKPTYFKLRNAGLGPREMRAGSMVRISESARLDWQKTIENPTGAQAEVVEKFKKDLRKRSHAAAQRAVKSPNHISARRRAGG